MARKRRKVQPNEGHPGPTCDPVTQKFLQETSLHGLKYIAQENADCCEKAFWICAFLAGMSLSFYFVSQVWIASVDHPIVLTVDTTNAPIDAIKFPAVTVCPAQQILEGKIAAAVMKLRDFNLTESQIFEASVVELNFDETKDKFSKSDFDWSVLDTYFRNANLTYRNITQEVSPTCQDMIRQCTWKSKTDCMSNLVSLLTPIGYCCAFNFASMADNNEMQYSSEYKGKGFGLQLVIDPRNNGNSNETLGHKILVHHHKTYPYRPSFELQVGPGEILNIGLEPVFIESDDEIRSVAIDARDCNFPDEYKMQLNLSHSYNNCIMDCFSTNQLTQCGCVQTYIQTFHPNATFCGIQKMDCVKRVLNNVMENLVTTCRCRPPCNEIMYNTESSVRNFTFLDLGLGMSVKPMNKSEYDKYAIVRVFFKESRFTKFKRSLRYGWEDFIAALGGLLGVGFGFSLLSAVEVIYFFCYKFWKPQRRKKPPNPPNPPIYRDNWTQMPITTVAHNLHNQHTLSDYFQQTFTQ